MKRILVLCTGNSCRSQIAEGYLRHFVGDKALVYSAGIEVHGVNQQAVKVMKEDCIDITRQTSNNISEYLGIDFDYVITVCDHANEVCPNFLGGTKRFHHNFPDPAKVKGSEDEILRAFREVRDLIKIYCEGFVKENILR